MPKTYKDQLFANVDPSRLPPKITRGVRNVQYRELARLAHTTYAISPLPPPRPSPLQSLDTPPPAPSSVFADGSSQSHPPEHRSIQREKLASPTPPRVSSIGGGDHRLERHWVPHENRTSSTGNRELRSRPSADQRSGRVPSFPDRRWDTAPDHVAQAIQRGDWQGEALTPRAQAVDEQRTLKTQPLASAAPRHRWTSDSTPNTPRPAPPPTRRSSSSRDAYAHNRPTPYLPSHPHAESTHDTSRLPAPEESEDDWGAPPVEYPEHRSLARTTEHDESRRRVVHAVHPALTPAPSHCGTEICVAAPTSQALVPWKPLHNSHPSPPPPLRGHSLPTSPRSSRVRSELPGQQEPEAREEVEAEANTKVKARREARSDLKDHALKDRAPTESRARAPPLPHPARPPETPTPRAATGSDFVSAPSHTSATTSTAAPLSRDSVAGSPPRAGAQPHQSSPSTLSSLTAEMLEHIDAVLSRVRMLWDEQVDGRTSDRPRERERDRERDEGGRAWDRDRADRDRPRGGRRHEDRETDRRYEKNARKYEVPHNDSRGTRAELEQLRRRVESLVEERDKGKANSPDTELRRLKEINRALKADLHAAERVLSADQARGSGGGGRSRDPDSPPPRRSFKPESSGPSASPTSKEAMYLLQVATLQNELNSLRSQFKALQNQREKELATHRDLETQASGARHHQSQLQQDKNLMEGKLNEAMQKLDLERKARLALVSRVEEEIPAREILREVESVKEQLRTAQGREQNANEKFNALNKSFMEQQDKIRLLRRENHGLLVERTELNLKIDKQRKQIANSSTLSRRLVEAQKQVRDMRASHDHDKAKRLQLKRDNADLRTRCSSLEREIEINRLASENVRSQMAASALSSDASVSSLHPDLSDLEAALLSGTSSPDEDATVRDHSSSSGSGSSARFGVDKDGKSGMSGWVADSVKGEKRPATLSSLASGNGSQTFRASNSDAPQSAQGDRLAGDEPPSRPVARAAKDADRSNDHVSRDARSATGDRSADRGETGSSRYPRDPESTERVGVARQDYDVERESEDDVDFDPLRMTTPARKLLHTYKPLRPLLSRDAPDGDDAHAVSRHPIKDGKVNEGSGQSSRYQSPSGSRSDAGRRQEAEARASSRVDSPRPERIVVPGSNERDVHDIKVKDERRSASPKHERGGSRLSDLDDFLGMTESKHSKEATARSDSPSDWSSERYRVAEPGKEPLPSSAVSTDRAPARTQTPTPPAEQTEKEALSGGASASQGRAAVSYTPVKELDRQRKRSQEVIEWAHSPVLEVGRESESMKAETDNTRENEASAPRLPQRPPSSVGAPRTARASGAEQAEKAEFDPYADLLDLDPLSGIKNKYSAQGTETGGSGKSDPMRGADEHAGGGHPVVSGADDGGEKGEKGDERSRRVSGKGSPELILV